MYKSSTYLVFIIFGIYSPVDLQQNSRIFGYSAYSKNGIYRDQRRNNITCSEHVDQLTTVNYSINQKRNSGDNGRCQHRFSELRLNLSCGRTTFRIRGRRIVGGNQAKPHSYPWLVSLSKKTNRSMHICGGTLIGLRHVITAAHCMKPFKTAEDLTVFVGFHHKIEKRKFYRAAKIIIHPKYDKMSRVNDIAIVTLTHDIDINDPKIGFICLPSPNTSDYPSVGTITLAIGWGRLSFNGYRSQIVREVHMPVITTENSSCYHYINNVSTEFCTWIPHKSKGTCHGDSGGPLMVYDDRTDTWTLAGIILRTIRCASIKTPSIFLRVSSYTDWIDSNTKSLSLPCVRVVFYQKVIMAFLLLLLCFE